MITLQWRNEPNGSSGIEEHPLRLSAMRSTTEMTTTIIPRFLIIGSKIAEPAGVYHRG